MAIRRLSTMGLRGGKTRQLFTPATTPPPSGNGVVQTNLVLHYDFGNTSCYPGTGTSITDLSSENLDGTLIGSPSFSSGNLTFTSNTQYGRVDSKLPSTIKTTAYTFCCWILRNSQDNPFPRIFLTDSVNQGVTITENGNPANSGLLHRNDLDPSGRVDNTSGSAVFTGGWDYVVCSWDGSNLNAYVNNTLVAGPTPQSTQIRGNSTLPAFMADNGGGGGFRGSLRMLAWYDRELTAAERQQNYDAYASELGVA
jgi:hypothetical protein